ncbi:uncharacterized protein LOC133500247 isoform X2 [Syngnathoides biaculeatus]|uniref:uncharacterized protein LOC133500247 isoform X2 n=1 Tax=Syngnathoides biaculeatus TaxID=300417 RepID=UPI002ADDF22F|nr:uncharacterized protein LOC133500247 isoform X2 [Syngnathoides biaculeatus]
MMGVTYNKQHLEGFLKKYTNLLQGWQNRIGERTCISGCPKNTEYFVFDRRVGQLDYYRNKHSKGQRPPPEADYLYLEHWSSPAVIFLICFLFNPHLVNPINLELQMQRNRLYG